ncbi:efflux RND transporter periplasmic adaptor subunit [Cerasicoccus fimbriatus]|uniref:efflux RND transporter periplasmic adaptor subunit n=1 Tax=Cerasicoccus fimbriatus TaxID=3014554 RepID=UPI0022B3E4F0|nr:efflux RND transporter periplasmic adaptor subunit [Cerasicoccus sp. TK19100]
MKSLWKILVILIVVGAIVAFTMVSSRTQVKAVPVQRGTALDAISGNVSVEAALDIELKNREPGLIVESAYDPSLGGVPVRADQVVFKQDTRDLDFKIENIKLELETVKQRIANGSPLEPDLETAKQELEESKRLSDIGQFPKSELIKLERSVTKLERQVRQQYIDWEASERSLTQQVRQLEERRSDMEIRAPIDGLLINAQVFPGDYVEGPTVLGRILSNQKLVRISISEEDYPGIRPGQPVSLKLLGVGSKLFTGEVTQLLPTSNAETKRRDIFVNLTNAEDGDLVDGMTGESSVTKASRDNTLIIPRRALLGNIVYVVNGELVEERIVETGFIGLVQAEITGGLQEGDQVVVEDPRELRHGDKVEVIE